jgi:hypothetical protein
VIARYDDCIRDTLEVILDVELSDYTCLQASLSVSAGGLGRQNRITDRFDGFLIFRCRLS